MKTKIVIDIKELVDFSIENYKLLGWKATDGGINAWYDSEEEMYCVSINYRHGKAKVKKSIELLKKTFEPVKIEKTNKSMDRKTMYNNVF